MHGTPKPYTMCYNIVPELRPHYSQDHTDLATGGLNSPGFHCDRK